MIRIGIVDDEKEARDQLRQTIRRFEKQYCMELDVREFEGPLAYLSEKDNACDILYLDIDMPQMSGMELAEKIREADQDVILIFCTNLQQFAVNGYSVGALGFIVKPIQWYSFHMYLTRALNAIRKRESQQKNAAGQKIVIRDGAISRFISAADLEYVEVQQHDLLYNIRDKESGEKHIVKKRGSMQEITAQLAPFGFVRCSSSFLVNISCITAVSRMNVYIGQETLPIGRAYKESFTDTFSRYLAKKGWDDPCLS